MQEEQRSFEGILCGWELAIEQFIRLPKTVALFDEYQRAKLAIALKAKPQPPEGTKLFLRARCTAWSERRCVELLSSASVIDDMWLREADRHLKVVCDIRDGKIITSTASPPNALPEPAMDTGVRLTPDEIDDAVDALDALDAFDVEGNVEIDGD